MSSKTIAVTDQTLQAEVLSVKGLVLVDFWAPWCGPCKALAPLLDELAEEYQGQVAIAKINADDNTQTAERFNVRGLPSLVLFKDGEECARIMGLTSKARLTVLFDQHLEA